MLVPAYPNETYRLASVSVLIPTYERPEFLRYKVALRLARPLQPKKVL